MRTFIAIDLPKGIKDYLAGLQAELKSSGADVKWVKPENIHLTLKFLGNINDKKLDAVKRVLQDTAKNKSPFLIHISSIGAFPKMNFPRVIWVGIDKGDSETKQIAKELEEKIQKLGIPKEKRAFSSHITIGRIRSPLNREKLIQRLSNLIGNLGGENLKFLAGKITLFKSTLTPQGPVYEAVKETSLTTT